MRKLFTLFVLLLCLKNAKAQYVTIPDPYFAAILQTYYSSAMNGNQMDTTAIVITSKKHENFGNSNILATFDNSLLPRMCDLVQRCRNT